MTLLEQLISLSIVSAATFTTVDYVEKMSAEIEMAQNEYIAQQKMNIQKIKSLDF